MAVESVNPATGEKLRSFEPLTDAELDAKLHLAVDVPDGSPGQREEFFGPVALLWEAADMPPT